MNVNQIISMAHSSLSGDECAIGQINDVFIDNNLKKIHIPNKKYQQNKFDEYFIDPNIQNILDTFNCKEEFEEWVNCTLIILENSNVHYYDNNLIHNCSFFINKDFSLVALNSCEINLNFIIERYSSNLNDYSVDYLSLYLKNGIINHSLTFQIYDYLKNSNFVYASYYRIINTFQNSYKIIHIKNALIRLSSCGIIKLDNENYHLIIKDPDEYFKLIRG